jgi:hypothetical protein
MRLVSLGFPIAALRLGERAQLRALAIMGASTVRIDRIVIAESIVTKPPVPSRVWSTVVFDGFRIDGVTIDNACIQLDVTRVPAVVRRKTKRYRLSKRAFRNVRMAFAEPETLPVVAAAFGYAA